MVLQTERLIIREFTVADIEAVHVYGSDPYVCTYVDWDQMNLQTQKVL